MTNNPGTFHVNGRALPRQEGLKQLLAAVDLAGGTLDAYIAHIEQACEAEEFKVLAASLLQAEIELARSEGCVKLQPNESITLCRDRSKTIFLTQLRGSVQGDAMTQMGITVDRRIDILANDVAIFMLGSGHIDFQRYDLVADASGRPALAVGETSRLTHGCHLRVERGRHGFEAKEASGDVWLLQVVLGQYDHLIRHFDRRTLEPRGVSSASFHATRVEFLLDVLSHCATHRGVDAIAGICRESDFHFVRWKAIQTLIDIDLSRGLKELDYAQSNDPHPHVRNAARRSLDALSA